jgi:hypothetical protein
MPDFTPKEFNEFRNNNPYVAIILPLVEAYGIGQRVQANPHETWLAAKLIKLRTRYWATNMPSGILDGDNTPEEFDLLTPTSSINAAVRGARNDGRTGADTPNTDLIQNFELKLRTLSMDQPNAWRDWNLAVDYFNTHVAYVDYFARSYKNGAYRDFYEREAGVYRHPDNQLNGLNFSSINGGEDATGTKATTTITSGGTGTAGPVQAAPYIGVYIKPLEAAVFWFNIDGTYTQPDTSGLIDPGITTYYEINLSSSLPPTDAGLSIKSAIDALTLDVTTTITAPGVVDVTTNSVGSKPSSVGTFPTYVPGFPGWNFSWVDGSVVDSGEIAKFDINFTYANEELADRFFVLSDLADSTTLLYYNLDGAGTFVPPVGLIPDATVAINITTGDSPAVILAATKSALDGLGYLTTEVAGLSLQATYTGVGLPEYVDPGDAKIGVNYTYYSELKAPSDGSVLASDVISDQDYAEKWNNFVIPYEQALGNTSIQYLNPTVLANGSEVGGGINYKSGAGFSTDCGCCWPVTNCARGVKYFNSVVGNERCFCSIGGGVLLNDVKLSFWPSGTIPPAPYNTPGNIWSNSNL